MEFNKILVIQTAFLGDVILATSLLEKLHQTYPHASLDFLVKKGNEGLVVGHPFIRQTLVFDKGKGKLRTLIALARAVRKEKYDLVVNVQRFFSSGFIATFSGAKQITGFDKNPFSFFFTHKIKHQIKNSVPFEQEIYRNQHLIDGYTNGVAAKPRLYPSPADLETIQPYVKQPFICLAPASVWKTKRLPEHKWVGIADHMPENLHIYLLGAPSDAPMLEEIKNHSSHPLISNLAGKFTFLQSAALMKKSVMNVVNDSGPMHLASAMNAPTCAVFCSTVENFGFGPLSDISFVVQTEEALDCKPCGVHGLNACPLGHFKCGEGVSVDRIVSIIKQQLK
ncbi:MAG: glycosyltransferase family 9 protein [Cytophagales bacterium]|nr:glycosyltransferase family 9 protein [Cytophagales bacterium]